MRNVCREVFLLQVHQEARALSDRRARKAVTKESRKSKKAENKKLYFKRNQGKMNFKEHKTNCNKNMTENYCD